MAVANNTSASSGGGINWGQILSLALPVVSSLAGGYLQGQGAKNAAGISADAADRAAQIQLQMYQDAVSRAEPYRQGGLNAFDARLALYGLPKPSRSGASFSGPTGNINPLAPNLGAGQPVVGHSGGGGPNGLAQAAGTIGGSFFGPIGSAVGGVAGGLIRNGGDNWKTIATQAPQGYDYDTYMQNPGLQAEWAKPDVQSLFGGNRDAYAYWHYNTFGPNGKNEGWVLNPTSGDQSTQPVGDISPAEGAANDNINPMDAYQTFLNSAPNRAASEVNAVDFDKIKGQLGAAGKSISGPGEARYAKTLAGNRLNAFNIYDAGLAGLSDTSFNATNNINAFGQTTAANVGTATQNAGNSRASGYAAGAAGLGAGVSGAIDALSQYGKKAWGWAA